jgi:hypothetical protein
VPRVRVDPLWSEEHAAVLVVVLAALLAVASRRTDDDDHGAVGQPGVSSTTDAPTLS